MTGIARKGFWQISRGSGVHPGGLLKPQVPPAKGIWFVTAFFFGVGIIFHSIHHDNKHAIEHKHGAHH